MNTRYKLVTKVLFRLLISLQVGMIFITEHCLYVASHQPKEERNAQASWNKVEKCGLRVLVDVHHKNCHQESGQVRYKSY